MVKRKSRLIAVFIFFIYLTGCNVTKHLKNNETLYTGGSVKINNSGNIPNKKTVRQELEEFVPAPNSKILGMRPKLWVYYNVDPGEKKKGVKAWLRRKFSEPPVLMEDINTETIEGRMMNLLTNKGFFQPDIETEEKEKGKKAELKFTASIKTPYRIKEVFYPKKESEIDSQLARLKEETLLKPNNTFSLEKLEEERSRLDSELKEIGYFYFNPDYLVFKVDSAIGDRMANIYMEIKPDAPEEALKTYTINRIILNPDYTIADTIDRGEYNRERVDGITFIKKGNGLFRPKSLTRLVFLEEDSLYSRKDHNITLNRLMGLDVFKYVNIRFAQADSMKEGRLNAFIQSSPLLKKSLRAEVQGYTKSTNFAGPAIQLSFKNRNAFRGAELLILNLNTGFETQFSGEFKNYYTYEFQPQVQLFLPRFLLPFNIRNSNSKFLPRTKTEVSYTLQNIITRYKQNSLNLQFGYQWKETFAREHILNPINVSYINFDIDEEYAKRLDTIPYLRSNFENQFILGSNYSYTYNNLLEEAGSGRNHFYFYGDADISGNLFYLLQKLAGDEDDPHNLWGVRYNQYARGEVDFRFYHDLNKSERIATRLNIGVGYPYGNSDALPFSKLFYAGGPSGLRAFRARTIGPGTFRDPDENSSFFTQLGDIKLQGSVEYRFDIISVLEGAVFVDAGNTWLTRPRHLNISNTSDSLSTAGVFKADRFLSELGVGTGFGLRVDVSFLVLRLDLAFPVRKLWFHNKETGEYELRHGSDRWAFKDISFFDPMWRKRNLVLNIAIGYPF